MIITKFIYKKLLHVIKFTKQYYLYWKQFILFKRIDVDKRFKMQYGERLLCLFDATATTGYDSHYLYHTAWAARILKKTSPEKHVDIGSLLQFVSVVSAFIPLSYYDYRPPILSLSNLECKHADILKLPFKNDSLLSLSCMHVLEHIGLGRYGDTLDSDGDLKGARELDRVLAIGGTLLIVLPVSGDPRIEFNAHRIYSYEMVLDMFPDLKLKEFSLITDKAHLEGILCDANPTLVCEQHYGCGCFHFVKE